MINIVLSKKNTIILSLIIFLLISCYSLSKWSIWYDESFSYFLINYDYVEIIKRTANDVHPPLYYLLLKFWSSLFGESLMSMRSMSVLFTLASIFINYSWIKRIFEHKIASLSVLLISVSPLIIRYSQEMRMYALGMFLVALANWTFVKIIFENHKSKSTKVTSNYRYRLLILYVILITLGLYTHYFLIFTSVCHAIFLLFKDDSKLRLSKLFFWRILPSWFLKVNLISLVLFSPWMIPVFNQVKEVNNHFWIPAISIGTIPEYILKITIYQDINQLKNWYAIIAKILLLGLVILITKYFWKLTKDDMHLFVGILAILPITLLMTLSIPPLQPVFHERYIVAYLPYIITCLSIIILNNIKKNFISVLSVIIIVIVVVIGIFNVSIRGNNLDWSRGEYFSGNQWSEYIKLNSNRSDLIIATSVWSYYDAYYYFRDDQTRLLLYSPEKLFNKGYQSLIYDRYELQVPNYSSDKINSDVIWVIKDGNNTTQYINDIGLNSAGWKKDNLSTKKFSYITVTRYTR